MPATVNGGGDQLARGAVRATFKGPDVSQEKWDACFGADSGPKPNISTPVNDPAVENPNPKRRKKK